LTAADLIAIAEGLVALLISIYGIYKSGRAADLDAVHELEKKQVEDRADIDWLIKLWARFWSNNGK
jgi:hypothetical protein